MPEPKTERLAEARSLEALLNEGAEAARQRTRNTFDHFAGSRQNAIVLVGAGGLGRRTLEGLRKHGVEPLAFTDNNRSLWGGDIKGIPVLAPAEATRRFGGEAVFVVTIWGAAGTDRMRTHIAQFQALGCDKVISFGSLYWKFADSLLPHYAAALPDPVYAEAPAIRQAFDLWADAESAREYVKQLRWRLLFDFDCLSEPAPHRIYFPHDLCRLSDEEVFLDCGAFDGDTLQAFLTEAAGRFRGYIAFEPDPVNFGRLREAVAQLPGGRRDAITLYEAATGAADSVASFAAGDGLSSHVGQGNLEVQCYALDSILARTPVTYLKMDIEGSERETLQGARRLIETCRPVLAVSCYHRQDDLWRIPSSIAQMVDDYRFYLRPHTKEIWDTVCYAIPRERLTARIEP
jgi:FkbM family methyltransferase